MAAAAPIFEKFTIVCHKNIADIYCNLRHQYFGTSEGPGLIFTKWEAKAASVHSYSWVLVLFRPFVRPTNQFNPGLLEAI